MEKKKQLKNFVCIIKRLNQREKYQKNLHPSSSCPVLSKNISKQLVSKPILPYYLQPLKKQKRQIEIRLKLNTACNEGNMSESRQEKTKRNKYNHYCEEIQKKWKKKRNKTFQNQFHYCKRANFSSKLCLNQCTTQVKKQENNPKVQPQFEENGASDLWFSVKKCDQVTQKKSSKHKLYQPEFQSKIQNYSQQTPKRSELPPFFNHVLSEQRILQPFGAPTLYQISQRLGMQYGEKQRKMKKKVKLGKRQGSSNNVLNEIKQKKMIQNEKIQGWTSQIQHSEGLTNQESSIQELFPMYNI